VEVAGQEARWHSVRAGEVAMTDKERARAAMIALIEQVAKEIWEQDGENYPPWEELVHDEQQAQRQHARLVLWELLTNHKP
jgi:hypothetical protein